MLFTTSTFFLLYLPIVLAGYYALGRVTPLGGAGWLLAASLFFYGWWMPQFTLLLVASIAVNFGVGLAMQRCWRLGRSGGARRWLIAGVGFDLVVLGIFKYANFFIGSLNAVLGSRLPAAAVILPIGISFYTFTQIAYLADTYQRKVTEGRWIHYGVFVTYFPHLVAGPVLHHAQMMPQFADTSVYRLRADRLIGGLAIFALGLAKKVILADGIAPYADAIFDPTDLGLQPSGAEAWLGALAYTLQLYFDFSGYSDMAIGLSWMFNIRLPFNFDSPYKALNISEFWRRWHMTLSAFLRDYLYVPLGGNRKGPVRRYVNLALTMLLGGLWHGAAWTFVVWGGLHGLYLGVNHAFRALLGPVRTARLQRSRAAAAAAWALTMLAVVVGWVFFRSTSFAGAGRMLAAMSGLVPSPEPGLQLWNAGLHLHVGLLWCAVLGTIACLAPNSNRIGSVLLGWLERHAAPRLVAAGAAFTLAALLVVVNTARESTSAFIYFNF